MIIPLAEDLSVLECTDLVTFAGRTLYLVDRTLTFGGRTTVQLASSLTRLDLTKEEIIFFVGGSEAAESKLVKLETRDRFY